MMRHPDTRLPRWLAIAALAALVAPAPASAVDGVIEINDARAIAGGVTPSDTPGYPVTLDAPGSYRLTGDLVVRAANLAGIEITADHVTIDLNGFAVTCSSACSGGGTGDGIDGVGQRHVHVRNGSIRGMADKGIHLGEFARLDDLRVTGSGGHGVEVADRSRIEACIIAENGDDGVHLGTSFESYLFGNQIQNNAGFGIGVGSMASFAWGHNMLGGNNGNGMGHDVDSSGSAFELDENYCVFLPGCPP